MLLGLVSEIDHGALVRLHGPNEIAVEGVLERISRTSSTTQVQISGWTGLLEGDARYDATVEILDARGTGPRRG